jgi:hypothetical protein
LDTKTFAEMRERLAALQRDIDNYIRELEAIKRDRQSRAASAADCEKRANTASQGLAAAREAAGILTRRLS